ncbi:MAG: 16S rRNA (guanine(527)-N(7))-methyltransferase RsmG [Geobacteraceae bacterium]|nr:16S rRNA (guanine(527)-N(7))-methyltransferase RsmG [Geobacteraceae bacterium]
MIRPDLEKALLEINLRISEESIQSFELFAAELKKWNRKFNLTAICNDTDIAIKHVVDTFFFAACLRSDDTLLDVGSGAGIPAIPLKIIKPNNSVVSVDAIGKKIMFQRHVARLLRLDRFEALHARVESLHSTHAGCFDVITSRAFSSLDAFVVLAAPLLKSGGRLIAMKGPEVQSEIDRTGKGLRALGFEICSVEHYTLPMNKGSRCLVTISAVNAHEQGF